MSDHRNAFTYWNPGMKRGIIVWVCLFVGLAIVDALFQENGILPSSWKWNVIFGLCGGVYFSVVSAYQAGVSSNPNQTPDVL